jgi:hypothetical protein
MWALIGALLLGAALVFYGWSRGHKETADGFGSWIIPIMAGAAIFAIALFLLLVVLIVRLAGG